MKQVILGGVVGGLVFFIFLSISWTMLPFHAMSFNYLPDSEPIISELQQFGLKSGLYIMPSIDEGKADPETTTARMEAGPIVAFMVYLNEGRSTMDVMMFVKGILLAILAAFVISVVLKLASPSLDSYLQRLLVVTSLGIFAAFVGPLTQGNWLWFPAGFVWAEVFDQIVGWTLAGLVIAAFVKKTA